MQKILNLIERLNEQELLRIITLFVEDDNIGFNETKAKYRKIFEKISRKF